MLHVLVIVGLSVTVQAVLITALVAAFFRPWHHRDHYSSSR